MRILFFSTHGGAAVEMALLCTGAGISLDIAGAGNRLVQSKATLNEQVLLRKFGVGAPSDEEILDTVSSGGYAAVVVSIPEQVQAFRKRIQPLRKDLPLLVRHSVNCFAKFQPQGIDNFISPSPEALSLMQPCNTFLSRKLIPWEWLPERTTSPAEREGFASYIHHYARHWPQSYGTFKELNRILSPKEVLNYGAGSKHGTVYDLEFMNRSRVTVHIKGGAICCFAVVRSMAMGTPVVIDEQTHVRCFFGGVSGIIVKRNVQAVADELRRLANDDDYWRFRSESTYRCARDQFSYCDELGNRFRKFLVRGQASAKRRSARKGRFNNIKLFFHRLISSLVNKLNITP